MHAPRREGQDVRPWGVVATAGLALLIFAVFVAIQFVTELAFVYWYDTTHAGVASYDRFGLLLALATLSAAPVGVALTVLAAALRGGVGPAAYLGLRVPPLKGLWLWALYLAIFIGIFHLIEYGLGRPFVTEFQVRAFGSADSVVLLLLAIVIAAPVFEELFFRGFIFHGMAHSRLGPLGAVLLCSVLWSVMHIQYAPVEIAMIFSGGLLLGYARCYTGSTYVPIALHALWNLSAAVETMIHLAL